MNNQPFKRNFLFNFLIPLIFFTIVFFIMPLSDVFQFDTDEGIQLVKAGIYNQGLGFTSEFWNDQPPFFTLILGKILQIIPDDIVCIRLLFVGFTTLLIWCFANILRLCVGDKVAIIGTFFLIISCNFLRLSGSVMIGMPSLAFLMLSIYTVILYQEKRQLYLVLISGLSFALSLHIKFFTLFLLPVILGYLLIVETPKFPPLPLGEAGRGVRVIIIWLLGFFSLFIISIKTNLLPIKDIFTFHISEQVKSNFEGKNSFLDVLIFYLQDLDYLLLAIIGIKNIKLDFKENLVNYIPLIWISLATILLINHKPVWYHHYLLISIPLTWLASYKIKELLPYLKFKKWYFSLNFQQLKRDKISKFTIFCLIFCLIAIPIKLGITTIYNSHYVKESQNNFQVVENILKNKLQNKLEAQNNWLFTDIAMYSFYSKMKIPPEIAVFSRKRLTSGELSTEKLLEILEKYHPQQVILQRFSEVRQNLSPYLETHYQKIVEPNPIKHYVLK